MALNFRGVKVQTVRLGTLSLAFSCGASLVVAILAEVAFVRITSGNGATDKVVCTLSFWDALVEGFVVAY